VHVEHTGAAALTFASAHAPDCVIIDVRLPDMTGWDLCRRMKADAATGETPIIVLTEDVSRAWAEQSAGSGCSAWLAQPTVPDDLVRAVRRVMAADRATPASHEEALLGLRACPACDAENVKATLRVMLIQYYCCRTCGFTWRVDTPPAPA
jgi:two-component system alkaline phosphatase synthesis response regulator PhoP